MVEWTGAELSAITYLWGKIYVAEIGSQALSRLLIVYQWTQRYFQVFGNLSTNATIMRNPKVNMDNIKQTYLRVDPDNFRVLSEIVAFCVASKFGPQVFAPDVQMTWQTFLAVVVSALGKQYH
uniref:Globin domain-containing protein n=1 Tax=Pundamilia nyererei TaxID=303518 RepID=A0A3B4FDM3_9CICH